MVLYAIVHYLPGDSSEGWGLLVDLVVTPKTLRVAIGLRWGLKIASSALSTAIRKHAGSSFILLLTFTSSFSLFIYFVHHVYQNKYRGLYLKQIDFAWKYSVIKKTSKRVTIVYYDTVLGHVVKETKWFNQFMASKLPVCRVCSTSTKATTTRSCRQLFGNLGIKDQFPGRLSVALEQQLLGQCSTG